MKLLLFALLTVPLVRCNVSFDHEDGATQVRIPNGVFERKGKAVVDAQMMIQLADNASYVKHSTASSKFDVTFFEEVFFGVVNGTVVESGGHDGLFSSGSYMLEHVSGWQAILVEGNPDNFHKMRKNRPDAISVHCALCEKLQTVHFINSNTVGGIFEFMDPGFLAGWHRPFYEKYKADPNGALKTLPRVQCVPFALLMKHIGVTHIDFWVLDIEGGELSVLKGLDWQSITINAIMMEVSGNKTVEDQKISILKAQGFKCTTSPDTKDAMCLHERFKPSRKSKTSYALKWE